MTAQSTDINNKIASSKKTRMQQKYLINFVSECAAIIQSETSGVACPWHQKLNIPTWYKNSYLL